MKLESEPQETSEAKPTKWFGLRSCEVPTEIQVAEFSDGTVQINICTDRPGMEQLRTPLRLRPVVFSLLADVMFMAAHDPSVWRSFDEDGS